MNGKKRLLVIDRDLRFGEVLQLRLQDDGFEVQQAADGQNGLRMAYDWHPNAILIEANLPGVDGFEACRRLRDMTEAVIIIVSAKGRDHEIIRGLEAGADPDRRLVFVSDGRSVQLTPREFDLLQYLLRNRGRVLTPEAILANVWGPEYSGEETLVKQFIHRLRMKIEPDPANPEHIVTIRGSGYALEEDTRPRNGAPRKT